MEDYLDLFDLAAHKIQDDISGNSSRHHGALQLITGEHMKIFVHVLVCKVYAFTLFESMSNNMIFSQTQLSGA